MKFALASIPMKSLLSNVTSVFDLMPGIFGCNLGIFTGNLSE